MGLVSLLREKRLMSLLREKLLMTQKLLMSQVPLVGERRPVARRSPRYRVDTRLETVVGVADRATGLVHPVIDGASLWVATLELLATGSPRGMRIEAFGTKCPGFCHGCVSSSDLAFPRIVYSLQNTCKCLLESSNIGL